MQLGAQPRDAAGEPVRQHPGDLRERVAGGPETALLGDHEPERDRGRLLVRQHQRRQARARPEPVATAGARLPVDRDAEVVQRDGVPPNRPLAHPECRRGRGAVDGRPGLEQLEEREQAGGGARDTGDSSTTADEK